MNIFLCGFMGCGKSTIGKELSKMKGCGFCDTDELIVKKEKMSIPEIFEKKGEKYFRQKETEILKELESYKGIVACGGGLMLNAENAEIAKKHGKVIFLNTPFESCYNRIKGDKNRPIVMEKTYEQLKELYDYRFEIYKNNSSFEVDADNSPMQIVKEIMKIIP